ncbi:hypothetical protein BX616_004399, partial [Lobosporangium transversale]
MSASPIARIVSIANAARLARVLSNRAFTTASKASFAPSSSPLRRAINASAHSSLRNESISNRFNFNRLTAQQQQKQQVSSSRLFSSYASALKHTSTTTNSTLPLFSTKNTAMASSPYLQGQAIRGFCKKAWRNEFESKHQAGYDYWNSLYGAHGHDYRRGRGWHGWGQNLHDYHKHIRRFHRHHMHYHRRRPMRFVFRMMALSTLFVAVPAIVVFDAPYRTLAVVPLTVFGTGAVLILAGRLLYVALPILAIGGATAFWVTTMPAASTVKDLQKILKRDEKGGQYSTALGALGSEWEIQRAQPNEWFRWTFPESGDKKQLDKVDIRIAVFDPNDYSDRKARAMRFLDKFQGHDDLDATEDMRHHWKKNKKYEDNCEILKSLQVKREGDQFVIKMEEDGEKVMEHPLAKKYLALGRIVDRAAKEMEASQPGLKLGEQVVLVHKNKKHEDSFWNRWSPYGDLSLRIPFNRTWINDLDDFETKDCMRFKLNT